MINSTELWQAYKTVCEDLLAERTPTGHWVGYLASSPLATATAVGALALVDRHGGQKRPELASLISSGLEWLARCQNPDGGWGDTDQSPSNIATTMLVRAAVHLADKADAWTERLHAAETYIQHQGGLEGLRRRYGKDQTFAVPILTTSALAGLVEWREVPALPFEWAALPHRVLGWVGLPVVSYAIPALVAMGQARFFHLPPKNPLVRWVRKSLLHKTLAVVEAKQPASGGFLEAVPLTSFVIMALSATGRADHPVAQRGVRFLIDSVRADGSWPIDTNLATWGTTLSLNALLRPRGDWVSSVSGKEAAGGMHGQPPARQRMAEEDFTRPNGSTHSSPEDFPPRKRIARECLDWVLACQHKKEHPFTSSAPGGWGWTDLSGAVPDADDTSGALLALAGIYRELQQDLSPVERKRIFEAVGQGLRWLANLQNRDGGWPTFCRGWGTLPFDRSATDLTAHALRAMNVWRHYILLTPESFPRDLLQKLDSAIRRGLAFLDRTQNSDGSWTPLWFGNVYWPGEENPIYGTSRVLLAYRDLGQSSSLQAQRGRQWLAAHQNPDSGWGGHPAAPSACPVQPSAPSTDPQHQENQVDWQSSVEETALAVEALLTDPKGLDTALKTLRNDPESLRSDLQKLSDPSRTSSGNLKEVSVQQALRRGVAWLVRAVQEGRHRQPEPIGLYFARLWYYEKLYPLIFTLSALEEVVRFLPEAGGTAVSAG